MAVAKTFFTMSQLQSFVNLHGVKVGWTPHGKPVWWIADHVDAHTALLSLEDGHYIPVTFTDGKHKLKLAKLNPGAHILDSDHKVVGSAM